MSKPILRAFIDTQQQTSWQLEPFLREIHYLYGEHLEIDYVVSDHSLIARAYNASLDDDNQLAQRLLRRLREEKFIHNQEITKSLIVDEASKLGLDIGKLLSELDLEVTLETQKETPILIFQKNQSELILQAPYSKQEIQELVEDDFEAKHVDTSKMGVLDFIGYYKSVTLKEINQVFLDNHYQTLLDEQLIVDQEGLISLSQKVYCDPVTGVCFI